jgi:HSP20 family molecular chaperone IbpA
VEVNVENNVLAIAGEKKQEVTEGSPEAEYHLVERRRARYPPV